jgi:hypothetical protein
MKKWQLPTQKGTELWPRTTVPPPKLVIEGVRTGTPIYRYIATKFSGRLNKFVQGARQAYALSSTESVKQRAIWGDGRATYANLQGQEYILLEVDHRVFAPQESPGVDYWDFALIEIRVPDYYTFSQVQGLYAYAHMTCPIEQRLQPGDVWPVAGVASNLSIYTRTTPDRIINAAESDDFVRSAIHTGTDTYASFTVDLRPARGLSAAMVDLHARVSVANVYPVSSWFTTGDDTSSGAPSGDPGGHLPEIYTTLIRDDPDSAAGIYAFIDTYFSTTNMHLFYPDYAGAYINVPPVATTAEYVHVQPRPAIRWDMATDRWVFDVNGDVFYDHYLADNAYSIDPGPTQRIDFGPWYRHWMIVSSSGGHFYDGPAPMPAKVEVTLFKGVPPFDVTRHTPDPLGDPFYRWTYADRFPDRAGHMSLADVNLPVYSDDASPSSSSIIVPTPALDISTLDNTPKLGTVVIGLKTTEGASWDAT